VISDQKAERLRREKAEGRLINALHSTLPAACRLL